MSGKPDTSAVAYWTAAAVIGVGTLVMVGVSMRMNYVFNAGFAGSEERGQLIGGVSIVADVFKATLLVGAIMLWRAGWKAVSAIAFLFWAASLIFATLSAVGFSGQERSQVVGGREAVTATYNDAKRDLEKSQEQLGTLKTHRSVSELEAAINARLAHPVVATGSTRVLGTLAAVSNNCVQPDKRTGDDCGAIASLREELGVAVEAARLEKRVLDLQKQVEDARSHGAMVAANPQAEVISWLTRGMVTVDNVAFAWPAFFALIVEGLSGFGPTIVFALVDIARSKQRDSEPDRARQSSPLPALASIGELELVEPKRQGRVIDYLTDCTDPADENSALGTEELFADYRAWCRRKGLGGASEEIFVGDFDRLREAHALDVRKFGSRYYGLRLRSRLPVVSIALPSSRRRNG